MRTTWGNIDTHKTVLYVPMRGTESDVAGMISATSNMKTVSDSRTVIPAERKIDRYKNLMLYPHFHKPSMVVLSFETYILCGCSLLINYLNLDEITLHLFNWPAIAHTVHSFWHALPLQQKAHLHSKCVVQTPSACTQTHTTHTLLPLNSSPSQFLLAICLIYPTD